MGFVLIVFVIAYYLKRSLVQKAKIEGERDVPKVALESYTYLRSRAFPGKKALS